MSAFTQNNLVPTDRDVASQGASSNTTASVNESEYAPSVKALLSSAEFVGAMTPLLLAVVGCILGIAVLLTKSEPEVKTAGLGLAGTAIAGSAGLAQAKTNRN